jgi:hypothetical protein
MYLLIFLERTPQTELRTLIGIVAPSHVGDVT